MQIVPLNKPAGYFTVVSDEDAAWAASLRLRYHLHRRQSSTALNPGLQGLVCHGRKAWFHRPVLERAGMSVAGLVTDHRDGWGLDNRRENLRVMTAPMSSWLRRLTMRGIESSANGFTVYHREVKLGKFPTHEEAMAAKVAAEQRDGYPVVEDREALLVPVIEFLEQCVREGRLRRHITGSPFLEDRYRV